MLACREGDGWRGDDRCRREEKGRGRRGDKKSKEDRSIGGQRIPLQNIEEVANQWSWIAGFFVHSVGGGLGRIAGVSVGVGVVACIALTFG